MSDDSTDLPSRQSPRRRTDDVRVSDFTMMVRVPGRPAAARVYIEGERDDAVRYAAETGGELVPLPLSSPNGYTAGPDGSMVLIASTAPDNVSMESSVDRIVS